MVGGRDWGRKDISGPVRPGLRLAGGGPMKLSWTRLKSPGRNVVHLLYTSPLRDVLHIPIIGPNDAVMSTSTTDFEAVLESSIQFGPPM